jgi:hypothetical protein
MQNKFKFRLLTTLIISTYVLIITEQKLGIAGIIVFILAYSSKGMRRSSRSTKPFERAESVAVFLDDCK